MPRPYRAPRKIEEAHRNWAVEGVMVAIDLETTEPR